MLKEKTAVVTGGSRGLGEAIAYKLASMGANIAVICAGNLARAEAVCETIRAQHGVEAAAYLCDVSDFNAVKETVSAVKDAFGTVHILVNNAGVTRDGLVAMMKEEDFDRVLSVNLKGAFNMIRHCTGLFIRNREGCIINITSVAGLMGNAGQSNYAASNAVLIGVTISVAKELAPKGVRCNAVAPGFILNPRSKLILGTVEEGLTKRGQDVIDHTPMGDFGRAQDMCGTIRYLLNENLSSFVTGVTIPVDGGFLTLSGV